MNRPSLRARLIARLHAPKVTRLGALQVARLRALYVARVRALMQDERAQATTEYILILTVSVTLVFIVVKNFVKPYLSKIASGVYAQMKSSLFNKANMHSFKIGGH